MRQETDKQPEQQSKKEYRVFFTYDTVRGIMLEVARHPKLESIVQMPGIRIGNDFFCDMVADSGMNATYQYGMVEKDHNYCDHLSTRIAEYYVIKDDKLTVFQFHRHPNGYDRFSPGDRPANIKLARQFGGVICGLMLVDPEFRIKCWYIDENGVETPVRYIVDDAAVRAAMPKKSLHALKRMIEKNEGTAVVSRRSDDSVVRVREKKSVFSFIDGIRRRTSASGKGAGEMEERFTIQDVDTVMCAAGEPVETAGYDSADDEEAMDFETLRKEMTPFRVLLPEEFRDHPKEGELRGYYIENTRTFNVIPDAVVSGRKDTQVIGEARRAGADFEPERLSPRLMVTLTEEGPQVKISGSPGAEVVTEYYSFIKDAFSRNHGVLESDQMADRQAVLLGLGSGGFYTGLELVRAGIGSIIAVDNDRFAYHNICRHECGVHDVGKYKTDCFVERAADINPYCRVYTFNDLIQHVDPAALEVVLWKKAVIVGCADNRHADYICNELADRYHIPMVTAGCGPRASTGEVFYYKPDCGMPCYTCAYGEDAGSDYSNQAVRREFYATESQLEKMHFQPGISLDIKPTAIFEAKLAIDLLMEGEEGYEPRLLPYVKQCTVLLNYPVDADVNPFMRLFENEPQGKRPFTWKSGPAEKNPKCTYCSNQ